MSDDRKDLPPVNSPNFLEKVREALGVYLGNRGDKLDRGVTLRDLTDSGIVTLRPGYTSGVGRGLSPISGAGSNAAVSNAYEADLTPPPTPSGFTASAAISNIFIGHDSPIYTQGHGHSKTVVYGATWVSGALPVFANAVVLTEFSGSVFSHPTNPATTWHLWIKWVTVDGVASINPAGGTNGLVVTTGQDVSRLVEAMTGPGNPFTILAVDTVIDGVTYPAGTYTTQAFIRDLQVTNAKIGNLAVDDAKVANLSVSKLTAGSLAVGQFAQSTSYVSGSSGWRINGDGAAEFSNVTVRGTVYASAGLIGGNTIDATGMQSPGYVAGSTGWRLGSGGELNAMSGTFKGDITGASGAFSGSLSAATGTFSGALSAASGTFSGSVNVGAFTGYAWPAAGQGGAHLSSSGLLLGNSNGGGKYFQIDSGVGTGNASISTNIPAFVSTLNIAGEAVTVPRAAQLASSTGINGIIVSVPSTNFGGANVVLTATAKGTPGETIGGESTDAVYSPNTYSVYRDGTFLKSFSSFETLAFIDSPGDTGVAYNVRVVHGAGSSSAGTTQSCFISVLGCKR